MGREPATAGLPAAAGAVSLVRNPPDCAAALAGGEAGSSSSPAEAGDGAALDDEIEPWAIAEMEEQRRNRHDMRWRGWRRSGRGARARDRGGTVRAHGRGDHEHAERLCPRGGARPRRPGASLPTTNGAGARGGGGRQAGGRPRHGARAREPRSPLQTVCLAEKTLSTVARAAG